MLYESVLPVWFEVRVAGVRKLTAEGERRCSLKHQIDMVDEIADGVFDARVGAASC
jgi:hypothetical protein